MTHKLIPMEVGVWEGVRFIHSPRTAFAKMRAGRARAQQVEERERRRELLFRLRAVSSSIANAYQLVSASDLERGGWPE